MVYGWKSNDEQRARVTAEDPGKREDHHQSRLCRPRSRRPDGAGRVLRQPNRLHSNRNSQPARSARRRGPAVGRAQDPRSWSPALQSRGPRGGAGSERDASDQCARAGHHRATRHARIGPRHHPLRHRAGRAACEPGGQGRPERSDALTPACHHSRARNSAAITFNGTRSGSEPGLLSVPSTESIDMNNTSLRGMFEATRLTREGRLAEATSLLQNLLRGGAEPADGDRPAGAPPPPHHSAAETIPSAAIPSVSTPPPVWVATSASADA